MTHDHHILTLWRFMFFVLLGMFVWGGVSAAGETGLSVVNCDVQNGACTRTMGGGSVTLEIRPRPVKAMTDLTFLIKSKGLPEKALPFIDLNMLVMDMGKNRVLLKRKGQGVYQGKGVIVRCRSGIRTWSAKVTFPGVGTTEFIFDVLY
jgi:hypothetical protein